MINEGHAATQLVNQLHDVVVENDNLSDKQKSIITEKLAVSRHFLHFSTTYTPHPQKGSFTYNVSFSCRKLINA